MNSKKNVQHVYLVDAKSLGAYGGDCEIIWSTRKSPDFMRVCEA